MTGQSAEPGIALRSSGQVYRYDYTSYGLRLGQQTGTNGSAYSNYAYDGQGSVEGMESAFGTISSTQRYRYDPFGELQNNPTSTLAVNNPFRYQGFYFDSGVKTYDMQARSYRPDVGRFLSQDRYESSLRDFQLQSDPLTQNRYAFAGGNPVSTIEFDGHFMGYNDQPKRDREGRIYESQGHDYVASGGARPGAGGAVARRAADTRVARERSTTQILNTLGLASASEDARREASEVIGLGEKSLEELGDLQVSLWEAELDRKLDENDCGFSCALDDAWAGFEAAAGDSPPEQVATVFPWSRAARSACGLAGRVCATVIDKAGGLAGKVFGGGKGGETRSLLHYTTERGRAGIQASGRINPGASTGRVYVTPTRYTSAAQAQRELALGEQPVGFFEVPLLRLPGLRGPRRVNPTSTQPGGGSECWVSCPVNARGLKFTRIGE